MIKDKNIMYIYCEIIKQLEPASILDVGMFIEAIGGVSRQMLDRSIPDNIYMTGVQTENIAGLNVYRTIYDRIITGKGISTDDKTYDLAILLSDRIPENVKSMIIAAVQNRAKYMLMYENDVRYIDCSYQSMEIGLDDVRCRLIIFNNAYNQYIE